MEIGWWVEIVTHHNRFLTLEWVFDILFYIIFFSFWADHYAFKPLFLTLVSFSLFVFVRIIFLFFATHCMCTRFVSLLFWQKCNQVNRMGMKHMFYVLIYVLFQIIESAGDHRDTKLWVKCFMKCCEKVFSKYVW